jgi:hypothetical protein
LSRYSTDASEAAYTVRKARGTASSPSIVSSGDTVVSYNFQGYDGASFLNAARIIAQIDGTPGLNDMPGRLIFSTTADGASSATERMRITSEGNVGIGTSTPAVALDITKPDSQGDVVARINATAAAGQTDADASFVLDAGALVTATVTAGAFVIGTRYRIATVGTTNFTLIGASANTVGITFVATGAGSGTGTAVTTASGESEIFFKNSSFNRAYVGWSDDTGTLVIDANNGGNDGSIRLTADGGTGVVDIRATNTGLTGITSRNTLRFSDSDTTTAANQPIGVIEFYTNDSDAGGTGVASYIMSAAAGNAGGGNLVFGTAPSAGSGSPVERMRIQSGGLIILAASAGLSISSTAVTSPSSADGNVFSGTYTPTLTNTTNIAASTASVCQYMRVGNVVTVSGTLDIDPTATGRIVLGMSLPIASNFSGANNLGGTFYATGAVTGTNGGGTQGDATNDRAEFDGQVADVANRRYAFSFTYRVI